MAETSILAQGIVPAPAAAGPTLLYAPTKNKRAEIKTIFISPNDKVTNYNIIFYKMIPASSGLGVQSPAEPVKLFDYDLYGGDSITVRDLDLNAGDSIQAYCSVEGLVNYVINGTEKEP